MSSVIQVIQYVSTFVMVVGFNCANPENWDSCKNVHQWLFPQLVELYYSHKQHTP